MIHAHSLLVLLPMLGMATLVARPTSAFDGSMSRAELDSYLSRAATMAGMVNGTGDLDEHIRMITNTGMKFAGRAILFWGKESSIPAALPKLKANADKLHAAAPDLILEGCSFEIVTKSVGDVDVPAWVFAEFGKPVVARKFNYADMVGRWGVDFWGKGTCVPDITHEEYQMWVYYLARNWIDVGCEAIHFGEMVCLCRSQAQADTWWDVLGRIRRYGAAHARRHLVLCIASICFPWQTTRGVALSLTGSPTRLGQRTDPNPIGAYGLVPL